MLNRRVLRIKAMQAIYAYEQSRKSNYELAIDHIHSKFELDWNVTESKTPAQIKEERQLAISIFKESYKNETIQSDKELPTNIRLAAISGIRFYQKAVAQDFTKLRQEMTLKAEALYEQYLSILELFIELSDYTETHFLTRQKHRTERTVFFDYERKFQTNFVVERLREHEPLAEEVRRKNIFWDKQQVIEWYHLLQKDEEFKRYRNLSESTSVQDYEIIDYIFRQFMLKHDAVVSYFESENLYWIEDKVALKSMVTKTLKAIAEAEDIEEIDLQPLSKNWEGDKEFFRDLYSYTIRNDDEYSVWVGEKLQNWAIERITQVDRIALKMAVAEMIHFPSIPIKATINEYIELAKNYSTARSKQFINGVLDTLAIDLKKKGKIRKSGRGLLDNK